MGCKARLGLSFVISTALICGYSSSATATLPVPNYPHVVVDDLFGRCFAHSVPEDSYSDAGTTTIYSVGEELDELHSFDWFASAIFLKCSFEDTDGKSAPVVVRLGRWPVEDQTLEQTLKIAFHFDGKQTAAYSALEIADGNPSNVICSRSLYRVIETIEGFDSEQQRNSGPSLYDDILTFSLITVDGRRLVFNAVTGERIRTETVELSEDDRSLLGNCL